VHPHYRPDHTVTMQYKHRTYTDIIRRHRPYTDTMQYSHRTYTDTVHRHRPYTDTIQYSDYRHRPYTDTIQYMVLFSHRTVQEPSVLLSQ